MKKKGSKPGTIKKDNRRTIIDFIRQKGRMSIPELSEAAGLSKTTVIKIIDYYLEENLVITDGKGDSTDEGGKRPVIYVLNARQSYVLAVHIFPCEILTVMTDLNASIIDRETKPIPADEALDRVLSLIVSSCNDLMSGQGAGVDKILGLAVALPGIVNCDEGIVRLCPRFPSWGGDIPFAALLSDKMSSGIRIFVDNEFRFQALAEKKMGAARMASTAVMLGGGEGMGSGIIMQDQVQRGSHYLAGEIGHMVINPHDGEICVCGGRGCLEVMVSREKLLRTARQMFNAYPDSLLFKGGNPDTLNVKNIFRAAESGDTAANMALDRVLEWFAIALSNLMVIYDPDIIVIHGIYSEAGIFFLEKLRKKTASVSLLKIKKDVRIEYSHFGAESGVMGAALFLISDYFDRSFPSG